MSGERWSPGIGDPTFTGWFTVVAYFVTGYLCMRASWRQPRVGMLWLCLCGLMVALGVNKQLDLQSWFTQLARDLALSGGWYEQRATVQRVFVGTMIFTSLGASIGAFLLAPRHAASIRAALAGAALLLIFVVVRASSFHHVDLLIGARLAGARFNSIIELSGIAIIAASALAAVRAVPVERSNVQS